MNDQPKTFAAATELAMTAATASLAPATTPSTTSDENAHRRHFVQTFRRWAMLFKRKDGDIEADKWLIAEYYKSLGHLSEAGLDKLTDLLKENCIFFPTIKECLDITRPTSKYDWAHPFLDKPHLMRGGAPARLAPPVRRIEHYSDE